MNQASGWLCSIYQADCQVGPLQLRPETGDQFYNLFFAGEKEKRTVMFDINGGKDSFSRPV